MCSWKIVHISINTWKCFRPRQFKQVVTIIWHKAASPPHTDGSVVFARWRQWVSHVTHASFGPPEPITQTASLSVQPFLHSSRQSIAYGRVSSGMSGYALPLKISPSYGGSGPHVMRGSLDPPDSASQTTYRSVQPFCTSHDCDRQTDRQTDRHTTLLGL